MSDEKDLGAHYNLEFKGIRMDPYRVLSIYNKITHPAHQHAVKKLLRAGESVKSLRQDVEEVILTLQRWLAMMDEEAAAEKEKADGIDWNEISEKLDVAQKEHEERLKKSMIPGGLIPSLPNPILGPTIHPNGGLKIGTELGPIFAYGSVDGPASFVTGGLIKTPDEDVVPIITPHVDFDWAKTRYAGYMEAFPELAKTKLEEDAGATNRLKPVEDKDVAEEKFFLDSGIFITPTKWLDEAY